jgi:hypothetical protein
MIPSYKPWTAPAYNLSTYAPFSETTPIPPPSYYQINGHWNPKGITIAAQSLLTHFQNYPKIEEPDQTQ